MFDAIVDIEPARLTAVRIGEAVVIVSSGMEREVCFHFLRVYVDDADVTNRRAMGAGATCIENP